MADITMTHLDNKADGYAVVEFPFAAGLHKSKGCTRIDFRQSRLNAKGGLRVKLNPSNLAP